MSCVTVVDSPTFTEWQLYRQLPWEWWDPGPRPPGPGPGCPRLLRFVSIGAAAAEAADHSREAHR